MSVMDKNLDIITYAVSLIAKAVIMASGFSGSRGLEGSVLGGGSRGRSSDLSIIRMTSAIHSSQPGPIGGSVCLCFL